MKHGRQVGGPSNGLQPPRQPFSLEQPLLTLSLLSSPQLFSQLLFSLISLLSLVSLLSLLFLPLLSLLSLVSLLAICIFSLNRLAARCSIIRQRDKGEDYGGGRLGVDVDVGGNDSPGQDGEGRDPRTRGGPPEARCKSWWSAWMACSRRSVFDVHSRKFSSRFHLVCVCVIVWHQIIHELGFS